VRSIFFEPIRQPIPHLRDTSFSIGTAKTSPVDVARIAFELRDPSKFLFVINLKSETLAVYAVSIDGKLAMLHDTARLPDSTAMNVLRESRLMQHTIIMTTAAR
jgi:hypothetical protein